MRTSITFLGILCWLLLSMSSYGGEITVDYFGQEPPRDSAVVFAPGIISLNNRYEYCPGYSPDGKAFYFGVTNNQWSTCDIWYTEFIDGLWTPQKKSAILDSMDAWIPTFSPDGSILYINATYPHVNIPPFDIWMCDVNESGLSNLRKTGTPLNSLKNEWRPTFDSNGMVVLCSDRNQPNYYADLFYGIPEGGMYLTLSEFGSHINSSSNEASPFISSDGSFIMFESSRSGGYGQADIYIIFKKEDGTWTVPKNMGPEINSSYIEDQPTMTPDGKYLMFCKRDKWQNSKEQTDIYWLSSNIIDKLKHTNFVPYVKNDMHDTVFHTGSAFSFHIPDNVFIDDDGNETLTISAKLNSGEDLPDWLDFSSSTRIFSAEHPEPANLEIKITATDTAGVLVSDVFKLTVENISDLESQIKFNKDFLVYPNPGDKQLYFESQGMVKNADYKIMTLTGSTIKTGTLSVNTIDISDFNEGIYLFSLIIDGKTMNKRIVIQK